MNITIHRGANQIGGCITEIATEGARIIIDLGSNLPGSKAGELNREDVQRITGKVDAIFYTHYHGDHVGLFHLVDESIPQYIGEGAQKIMQLKFDHLSHIKKCDEERDALKRFKNYHCEEPIDINGKIRVIPYFVSHSAFDAYMFKIEIEGFTLLHTGDFRKHGYIGKGLLPNLKWNIGNVDILITEGTMLGRQMETILTEREIGTNVVDVLKKHKYVYALGSSTDMERLASFHNACKKTERVFVCDKYQKQVLDVFSKYAGVKSPLFNFDTVFELINIKTANVRKKLSRQGFLMVIRSSQIEKIRQMMDVYNDEDPYLIYAMWKGYHKEGIDACMPEVVNIRNLFGHNILDGTKDGFHTSGHADVATLEEVCKIVKPRLCVIPIHKEENSSFSNLDVAKLFRIVEHSSFDIKGISISIV